MEILTVPLFIEDGLTYIVTCELFGATQGAGELTICNTPDGGDVAIVQTIVSWSDTEIEFTFATDAELPTDGIVWV
ncbi:hypothetical protein, partial [Escherichia coli]|uniref:hypothetical protein n=1 Tax=Escherichia coli TaxID=562 RepID=UPI001BC86077